MTNGRFIISSAVVSEPSSFVSEIGCNFRIPSFTLLATGLSCLNMLSEECVCVTSSSLEHVIVL